MKLRALEPLSVLWLTWILLPRPLGLGLRLGLRLGLHKGLSILRSLRQVLRTKVMIKDI